MPVYKWQQRPTKHFGEVLVPFARVELQRGDGIFQPVALQIDSGAVISTLRRSSAALLGLELESGRPIDLRSVSGGITRAFVHEITTQFDPHMTLRLPFAVMDSETVPNLLGRLGVFDRVQVHFDPTLDETQFLDPWLDPKDRRIWEFLLETEAHILARWPELHLMHPMPTDPEVEKTVKNVARRFLERMGQLMASVRSLLKEHTRYGAPVLIRAMFELAWQFEYLMQSPAQRAMEYSEFYWITKHKQSQALVNNPVGVVSKRLAESHLRPEGEEHNRANFDRVRPMFMVATKGRKSRLASKWYKMSIQELADCLGRGGEYRLIYAGASAWAHADPSHTEPRQHHVLEGRSTALLLGQQCYERILFLIAEAGGKIMLSKEQYEVLRLAMRENA